MSDLTMHARVERAEKAALGSVTALRRYIEAADAWFKAAAASDHGGAVAALDKLLDAHNGALAWAREEAESVRRRTGSRTLDSLNGS